MCFCRRIKGCAVKKGRLFNQRCLKRIKASGITNNRVPMFSRDA